MVAQKRLWPNTKAPMSIRFVPSMGLIKSEMLDLAYDAIFIIVFVTLITEHYVTGTGILYGDRGLH